jgi:hypothetical protein
MCNCKTTTTCTCKTKHVNARTRSTSLRTMYAQLAAQRKKFAHLYNASTHAAAAALQAQLQQKYNVQQAYVTPRATHLTVSCKAYYATASTVNALVAQVLQQHSAALKSVSIANNAVYVHLHNAA